MRTKTRLLLMLLLLVLPVVLIACDEEENDGDSNNTVEQAATDAADAANSAGDALATEAADAVDAADDAVDAAATEVADAADDAGDAIEAAATDVADAVDDTVDAAATEAAQIADNVAAAVDIAIPDIDLPGTFEADANGVKITVLHPAGWVAEDREGTVLLGSNADAIAALSAPELNLAEGQEGVMFMVMPTMGQDILADAIPGITAGLSSQEGVTVEETENITLDGKDGVRVAFSSEDKGSGHIYVVDLGNDYMMIAIAASNDFDNFAETATAIIGSADIEVTDAMPTMEATEAAG